ncbi:MAG: hypothetical protein J3Q66DRAFT_427501 [Benniella sp.]|nr:MAG: hypothetical protein J3Q66DRAFT_427501 [Benniella sp.]
MSSVPASSFVYKKRKKTTRDEVSTATGAMQEQSAADEIPTSTTITATGMLDPSSQKRGVHVCTADDFDDTTEPNTLRIKDLSIDDNDSHVTTDSSATGSRRVESTVSSREHEVDDESFGQASAGSSLATSSSKASSKASSILNKRKRPTMDQGRRSSVSAGEDVVDHIFNVDPTKLEKSTYQVGMVDVGRLFLEYQVAVTATVNDPYGSNPSQRALVSSCKSMNFVWDLEIRSGNISDGTYKAIKRKYTWPRSTMPENVTQLCNTFDEQLAEGSEIEVEETLGNKLRSIRHLHEKSSHEAYCGLFIIPERYRRYLLPWHRGRIVFKAILN